MLLEPSFCQLSPAPLITLTHLSFSGGLPIALQRTGGLPAHCASPWSSGQEQKPQPTPACLPACLQQFFPIFFRTSLAAAAFSSFFLSPCPSHSSWELAGNQQQSRSWQTRPGEPVWQKTILGCDLCTPTPLAEVRSNEMHVLF